MTKLVGTKKACEIIGCSSSAIHRYKAMGLLKWHVPPKGNREAVYSMDDVLEAKKFRDNPDKAKIAAKKRKPVAKTANGIQAICPRCGRQHLSTRKWIGTGTPRFYCNRCRDIAASWSSTYQNQAAVLTME